MKQFNFSGKILTLFAVFFVFFQQGNAQSVCSTFTTANLVNNGPFTTGAGTTPQFGSVADFNEDGNPDYVAAVFTGGKTVVFLGNGTGGFGAGLDLPAATASVSPQFTAVGDFNEDNNVDIAVTNVNGDNISIWLGNGNGTFGARNDIASIDAVRNLVVADFNNDGNVDLAAVGSGTSQNVAVHLGTGTGTFGAAQLTAIGGAGFGLVTADFNEDGNADLYTGVGLVGKMLLGNGTGGFTVNNVGTFAANTEWISVGDFNNDNNVDVVIDNVGATNNVNIFLGNGLGGLTNAPGSPFTNVGAGTFGNAVGDINGDGNLDLAVSNLTSANVTIYLGNGTGAVTSIGTLTGYSGPRGINFTDLNNDGRKDLVIIDRSGGAITTRVNNCPVVTVNNRTKFDFDGDRKADISVFRPSSGTWFVIRSATTTGFTTFNFGISTDEIVPGDYDGDGKTDYAVFRPSNSTWYIQNSTAGFSARQFGTTNDIPAPGDFDGDGKTDIAVFRPSTGTWFVQGSTSGFTAFNFGTNNDVPIVGDYDGDGKDDYAVMRPSNNTWYIQKSTAGFSAMNFGVFTTDYLVPGDYDGDGKTDIAVWRFSGADAGTWYVQGSTSGFTAFKFGLGSDLPAPADFDGDGKTDYVVYRENNGTWYLQQSTAGFAARQFGNSTDYPVPFAYVR